MLFRSGKTWYSARYGAEALFLFFLQQNGGEGKTMKRVVITGNAGVICGGGTSEHEVFNYLFEPERDFAPPVASVNFDGPAYSKAGGTSVVCSAGHCDETLGEMLELSPREMARLERHQLFALLAAATPMRDLDLNAVFPQRFGIAVGIGGCGYGAFHKATIDLAEGRRLSPVANLQQLSNVFAGQVAQKYGLMGPSNIHVAACAASSKAIADAVRLIRCGDADIMLVGGTEAAITPFGIGSFYSQRALGDCLPYQTERNGFVMGEGAAMFVVESLEHAQARGANIRAEIVGYGETTDGDPSVAITAPVPAGGARSAQLALSMANLQPVDVSYINTHGTGTQAGDAAEIAGLRMWAGDTLPDIMVSSTKSRTGHLLGAAGALEALMCVHVIESGCVPATFGLTPETLDPKCVGPDHIMGNGRGADVRVALSNSFGFGGTNATLALKRFED